MNKKEFKMPVIEHITFEENDIIETSGKDHQEHIHNDRYNWNEKNNKHNRI